MSLQPVDGGSGNVNGDFKIIDQQPAVLLQAGNKIVDAITVWAEEKAFGVPFTFTVSTKTWEGAIFETYTRVIASYIQAIGQHPHVVGIYSTPDTDRQGLLHDFLFITVGLDNADSTAEVKVLQDQANSLGTFQAIDDAYTQLAKNQALGN